MRIEYDGDSDILCLQFKAARQVTTVEVSESGAGRDARPKRVRCAPTKVKEFVD